MSNGIGIEAAMHCRLYLISYILVTFARSGAGLLQAEAQPETLVAKRSRDLEYQGCSV